MSTSTQSVKPDPGALEGQHKRQHRWSKRKKIGALAAAAAVALVLIAALLIIQSREEAPATDHEGPERNDPEEARETHVPIIGAGAMARIVKLGKTGERGGKMGKDVR